MNKVDIDGYYFFDADLMPSSPNVLEVGAYTDHAVKPILARYPNASMAVVEASLNAFALLQRSLQSYPSVRAYNLALNASDSEVVLNEYVEGFDANSVFERDHEGLHKNWAGAVSGLTLGTLMSVVRMDTVDLLLLNCEGGELFALQQLSKSVELRDRVKQISLSFHCDHVKIYPPSVRDELLQRMEPYYTITKGTDWVGYYLMVRK